MTQRPSTSGKTTARSKIFWSLLAGLFVIGLLVLLGLELFSDRNSALAVGQTPEDFTLQTYSGETLQSASLRGKTLLINFWSSWCTTCDEESTMLEEAWKIFQTRGEDVVFIGVAYMDTEPDALAFLDRYGVTYPNGPDLRGEISNLYRVSSVPETFILDKNGVLRVIKMGPFTSTQEIMLAIEAAAGVK